MFILKELDKLLLEFGAQGKSKNANGPISIADIEPIDVSRFKKEPDLPFGPPLTYDQMTRNQFRDHLLDRTALDSFVGPQRYPTVDSLFLQLMDQFVFSKLAKLPERQYPWTKLLICDRFSYDLLLKYERIHSLAPNSIKNLKNFLYRPPFSMTAIFELDNIATLIDLSGEPLILNRRDPRTGKQVATHNYLLVRTVFPYLKMSDLVVIIEDKGQLESRLARVLLFLANFARSFQLIELGGLHRIIGSPHLIYDNVLVVVPKSPVWADYYSRLPFAYLSFMATQLASIAEKLKLRLETVTYRAADPHQQARMFAHFLATAVDKEKKLDLLDSRIARVLVLDRFHDLRGTLLHADRFEAFLGQERSQLKLLDASSGGRRERPTLGNTDEQLNSKLHLVRLTEVLGVILKHATQLRPGRSERSPPNKPIRQSRANKGRADRFIVPKPAHYSLSAVMSATQSIRRHLDTVKVLYKSLNGGYLILLKLESSAESIFTELRRLEKPLDEVKQISLAERLQRLVTACRLLIKVSTKTIDLTDITRLACLIADAINLFCIHNRSEPALDLVAKAKVSLLNAKDFKVVDDKKSKFESSDRASNLFKKCRAFDSLSASTFSHRSTLTIEETLEQLLDDKLDQKSHPTNNLVENPNYSKDIKITIVLVFLGALTAAELARIKLAENHLRKQHQLCDIIVLSSAIVAPNDFLAAV